MILYSLVCALLLSSQAIHAMVHPGDHQQSSSSSSSSSHTNQQQQLPLGGGTGDSGADYEWAHLINLVKCAVHIPSIVYINEPNTDAGRRSLYASQVATVLLKFGYDSCRTRMASRDIFSYLRFLKFLFGYLPYCMDCHEFLKRAHECELGKKVVLPKGTQFVQATLLLLEASMHAYFFAKGSFGSVGMECADIVEIVRLLSRVRSNGFMTSEDIESLSAVVEKIDVEGPSDEVISEVEDNAIINADHVSSDSDTVSVIVTELGIDEQNDVAEVITAENIVLNKELITEIATALGKNVPANA